MGKLRPRWEGPFPVDAVAGPNTYTLTLPERFKCSPTIKVDRLKRYFLRTGLPPSPGSVTHPPAGQAGEYAVDQLLNSKTVRGRIYCLVLWQAHAADWWKPA